MWNPFKKLFKKNNMINSEEIERLKERLSGYAKYQWIKGEHAGNITEFCNVCVENDGMVWIEFMDGSRINQPLLDQYLIKTNNTHELLDVEKPLAQEAKTNVSNVAIRETPKVAENPIHTLLKRQKPNPVDIDITIELNIPSPELFSVIMSSFDNAEEETVNYIVSGLDINTIKESVKNAISKYYAPVK